MALQMDSLREFQLSQRTINERTNPEFEVQVRDVKDGVFHLPRDVIRPMTDGGETSFINVRRSLAITAKTEQGDKETEFKLY